MNLGTINVTFCNKTGDTGVYSIWDLALGDGESAVVFSGSLDPEQCTDPISLSAIDPYGTGAAQYARLNSPAARVDNISDGATINLEV